MTTEKAKAPTKADVVAENKALKEQLENQGSVLEQLQAQMALLLSQQNEKTETKKEVEQPDEIQEYIEIPSNKRVSVTHMVYGGTTLIGAKSKYRFENRGQRRNIKFEDLEELRYGDYSNIFENIIVYIKDKDVRKALDLDQYYDKYNLDSVKFEAIVNMGSDEMVEAIKGLPQPLQVSFATFFIDGANEGKEGYSDRNKWAVLNNYFNINIKDMLED